MKVKKPVLDQPKRAKLQHWKKCKKDIRICDINEKSLRYEIKHLKKKR
jgi:hypothetical protein